MRCLVAVVVGAVVTADRVKVRLLKGDEVGEGCR